MEILLAKVCSHDLEQYKHDMQESFQKGYENTYGKTESVVLPEKDIDCTLNQKGSAAYKAILDNEIVGGAVVTIDHETQHNRLELFFVKYGMQSKGIGTKLWFALEQRYPDTKIWETYTPYFEKRNIHFYVNICGFHIVKYFNEIHPLPDTPEDFIGDGHEGMFALRKTQSIQDSGSK